MNKEYIDGIINHENQKIFNGFTSLEEYFSYRAVAVGIVNTVSQIMRNPFCLQSIVDIITADSPYTLTAHSVGYEGSSFGETLRDYTRITSEYELETANKLSGGAIKWDKHTKDNVVYYFIYVDPADIKVRWDWINNSLSTLVSIESNEPEDANLMMN